MDRLVLLLLVVLAGNGGATASMLTISSLVYGGDTDMFTCMHLKVLYRILITAEP